MTTNTIAIDDLLAKVGSDLVEKYEKINLSEGQTLRQVNEEYLGMNKNPRDFLNMMNFFGLFATLVIFFLSFVWIRNNKENSFISLIPIAIWVVSFAATLSFLDKKTGKNEDKLGVLTSILKEFREAVEALDNPVCHSQGIFSVEFIRNVLIIYAVKLLEAERAFDKVRFLPERRPIEIMLCGDSYQKYQEHLRCVFMVASKKFGLEFTMSDIFGEATKRLAVQA